MARLAVGFATLTVALLALAAAPARAGTYKSEEYGYKVGVPPKWDEIPVKLEERWIVARFLSQKEYRYTDEGGWSDTFKPEMRVIVFPFSVTKGDGEQEVETEGGTVIFRNFNNPYKDYEDYLKRTYSGGGWFISKREEKKARDLEWTLLEIKVEKLARSGKKRIVAGVFHIDDADFVVQIEVLEETYDKLRSTIYHTLSSFEFIPRKGSLAPETTDGPRIIRSGEGEEELSPELRRQRRVARQKSAYEKLAERLPKGWYTFEYKDYFYVLSHVDRKYANYVCKHGENVWRWLDKNLEDIGEDEPRPIIIRICESREEESAYHGGGGGVIIFGFSSSSEVVLSKGDGREIMWNNSPFSELNDRILSNWMQDKDSELYWDMPSWLRSGLGDLVGSAWTQKNGRLEFAPDVWQRRDLAIAAGKGELRKIQDVLTLSRDEIGNAYHSQTASIVRFLLDGPGRRHSVGKQFLPLYIAAAKAYAKEREEKDRGAVADVQPSKEPRTEEEEEAMLKKRRERRGDWEKRELEHLRAIFDRAFADWTEGQWRSLESLYRKWLAS